MASKATIYLIFVAVGLVITTANLFIYVNIGGRKSTGSDHHRHHSAVNGIVKGGKATEIVKPPSVVRADDTKHSKVPAKVKESQHAHETSKAPSAVPNANKHHHHGEAQAVDRLEKADAPEHHHHHAKADASAAGHLSPAGGAAGDAPPHNTHNDHKRPSSSKAPVSSAPPKRKHKYVASQSDRSFANISYDEALDHYHEFLNQATDDIEQSSNKFRDIEEHSHAGVRLPTDEEDLLSKFGIVFDPKQGIPPKVNEAVSSEHSFCDPLDADYTDEKDAACLRYLMNVQNMLSIKPMSSILSSGRTIKFKLYYKHSNITAVVKVSQKKFALEPASEVIALKIDRWMGFYRVPPVAWTPISIDFLRAGCATMDAFYAKWFDKFVLHYDTAKPLTSTCFIHKTAEGVEDHQKCLNVSIQLWMSDVRNAEETVLRPSEAFRKYLELPSRDATGILEKIKPKLASGEWNPKHIGLSELMDEFIFDLVIGNTDRWFGHNSFALGGCVGDAPCARSIAKDIHNGKLASKSSMRLAFIDQGSSFYRKGAPEMNPFAGNYEALCRFPKKTVDKVLTLVPDGTEPEAGGALLYDIIRPRIPTGVFNIHNQGLLRAAGTRLATLAGHIRSCLKRFNASEVKYFLSTPDFV